MFEKREILIASGNPYKQKKLVELVAPFFVPRIAEKLPSFQERGESFLSIAENKAIDYSKHFHSLVVSTDGGASIPALSPEEWNPLITRRFLNADDDRERIHKVLDLMKEKRDRTVEWREAIAVADNGVLVFSHEARAVDGVISKSFRPEFYQEGIWLCSITDFPQFGGRNYFELTDEERKQTENSWELLREAFQEFFSKELIDLVDTQNNVIGTTDVEMAHKHRQLHRVVGVFLFDSNGDLCLQDGNDYKKYDLSVGGHVRQGEAYEDAAQREMQEELGIQVPLVHISTFLPSNAKLGHFWAIYRGELPSGWKFSPTEEVSSVTKMSMEEISEKLKASPELFTHGFFNAFTEFIRVKGRTSS